MVQLSRTRALAFLSRESKFWSPKRRCLTIFSAVICWIASADSGRAVILAPGDLIIATLTQIQQVNPTTGQTQVFANGSATSTFFNDVASSPDASIKAITSNATSGDAISRVDATGAVTPLASFGSALLSNLDVGASGTIYALENASSNPTTFQSNNLVAVNPTTGMASTVFTNTATTGPTPGINVKSLSLLPGGLAAFIGFGSSLTGNAGIYIYNFASGSASLLVQGGPLTIAPGFGEGSAAPSAIATLPNGQLLVTSNFGQGSENFNAFEVNRTTGAVTPVGSSLFGNIFKIAVTADGSTAYLGGSSLNGSILEGLSLSSGTTTSIIAGTTGNIDPAVVAPEPTSLVLTAFGIGALALASRRGRGASV